MGAPYLDENTLPTPEGPANPVVEIWNNTNLYTFIEPGTSLADDLHVGYGVFYIAPHADQTGPSLDADAVNAGYTVLAQAPALLPPDLSSGTDLLGDTFLWSCTTSIPSKYLPASATCQASR